MVLPLKSGEGTVIVREAHMNYYINKTSSSSINKSQSLKNDKTETERLISEEEEKIKRKRDAKRIPKVPSQIALR